MPTAIGNGNIQVFRKPFSLMPRFMITLSPEMAPIRIPRKRGVILLEMEKTFPQYSWVRLSPVK